MLTKHVIIVVADDDPAVNQLVYDILSDEGYTVLSCFSGEEALVVIRRVAPDLAIIDMQMETNDAGLKVLESIRRSPDTRHVKTIIFSADEDALVRHRRSIEVYGGEVVRKPFFVETLTRKVKELLSQALF